MTKTKKPQCSKIVFSGQRWDMGGHRCGRNAMEGSDLCRQHYDQANPAEVLPADQNALPQVKSSAKLTTELRWDEGEGPIIVDYGKRYYVRVLQISMHEDSREPLLRAWGAVVKADGSEGKAPISERYLKLEHFSGQTLNEIKTQATQMEDIHESIRMRRH